MQNWSKILNVKIFAISPTTFSSVEMNISYFYKIYSINRHWPISGSNLVALILRIDVEEHKFILQNIYAVSLNPLHFTCTHLVRHKRKYVFSTHFASLTWEMKRNSLKFMSSTSLFPSKVFLPSPECDTSFYVSSKYLIWMWMLS